MPDGTFAVELVGGVPVVAAPEEIDVTNAEALRSALLKAAMNGHTTIVVDMTATRFCDSSGLHTLMAARKRAEGEGREVVLVIPSTTVLRVFAITGMDRVIPTFTTLPEALAQTRPPGQSARIPREPGDRPGAGNGRGRAGTVRRT
jgi:anti-sigma B factor antagonist